MKAMDPSAPEYNYPGQHLGHSPGTGGRSAYTGHTEVGYVIISSQRSEILAIVVRFL